MSDIPGNTGTGTAPPPAATNPPTPPSPPPPAEHRTPDDWAAALARTNKEAADRRHALKAAEESNAALAAELAALRAEKATAEAEKLRASGEWQKVAEVESAKAAALAAENAGLKAQAERYQAGLKARETALLETIPEGVRAKIRLDGLTAEDRISTLESFAEITRTAAPPPPPGNAPNLSVPPANRIAPVAAPPPGVSRADQVKAIHADRSLSPRAKAQKLASLPK